MCLSELSRDTSEEEKHRVLQGGWKSESGEGIAGRGNAQYRGLRGFFRLQSIRSHKPPGVGKFRKTGSRRVVVRV